MIVTGSCDPILGHPILGPSEDFGKEYMLKCAPTWFLQNAFRALLTQKLLLSKVQDELDEFNNTFLVIVDEISSAYLEDMELLNEKMKEFFERPLQPFRGVPVVFCGDFAQLSAVG
ncbi:PIF1-like helicase [Nitzschia inconspicua]|uniref:ATP-dependent DNA helicase n=1 Tax=Nitzschia inconspicua TaxID=303405 RepID=A0A9K3PGF1_9STRA|nr:PIF1-like helicase [Nitzschia inconspicua]